MGSPCGKKHINLGIARFNLHGVGPHEVKKMRRSKSNQGATRQWLCPQTLACVWLHIRGKGGGIKFFLGAKNASRFLSTVRSMSWAPDKGGAGGRACPERLGKWAGGVEEEKWGLGGAQLNSHLHVGPPPHHTPDGALLVPFWNRIPSKTFPPQKFKQTLKVILKFF